MLVYVIENLVTGKKYVGKTTRNKIAERWKEHCSEARQGRKQWKLYADMRELGFDKFTIAVVGEAEYQARINQMERRFIREFDSVANGYNVNAHGGGGGLRKYKSNLSGCPRSDEVKAKIRATVLATLARKKAA